MKKEAQYDAQCAKCRGRIEAGGQMDYLPPTGDFPALTTHHPQCPEQKPKKARGVNHGQRQDPELVVFRMRDCDQCGDEYAVRRTSLASRRPAFVCHHCEERNAEVQAERHLSVVA